MYILNFVETYLTWLYTLAVSYNLEVRIPKLFLEGFR